ncbi:hypothetical protein [Carboxylicivirga marina]|uniref:Uncharacterized protein n=1 Tax=Carboxylicivirga marina TaxID=2800988 RepID=A0ABS1HGH0_9BACT|nr:hypothetical protein [Carboxylicivirga marina]MBK3516585.1 hypothetical protein [Carboxylicivirga marina]
MWIKTKSKKTLVKVIQVKKYKTRKSYSLQGICQASLSAGVDLGKYESEELADAELKAIENCIKNGENFYEMT